MFESDFQAEWNRAAISGAARALRSGLDRLPEVFGGKRLWELLQATYDVGRKAESGGCERSLGAFWAATRAAIPTARIVPTTDGKWRIPPEVLLLENEDEYDVAPVLEKLGLALAHPDIRPHAFQMPRTEMRGLTTLTTDHVINVLRAHGLTKRTTYSDAPNGLQNSDDLRLLWRELCRLMARRPGSDQARASAVGLASCSIAPASDGALWPCRSVFRADPETVALFQEIDPTFPFFDRVADEAQFVEPLCPRFSAQSAVEFLARFGQGVLERIRDEGHLDPLRLLRWFEARRDEILAEPSLVRQLTELAIFPTVGGLRPLTHLTMPGGFTDPLGLAEVVDVECLEGRTEFLRDLGAQALTFDQYVLELVPRAFTGPSSIPREKKRELVNVLATLLGAVRDKPSVQAALANLELIECEDGEFRKPTQTYLPTDVIKVVLGDQIHFAQLPGEREEATRECYLWLGVVNAPRGTDVVERLLGLVATAPTVSSVRAVQAILDHLGERWRSESRRAQDSEILAKLKSMAWLPARGDHESWFTPREVHASFRDYLFETQARFLDLPRSIEVKCADFFNFLGVTSEPTVAQVVQHLLECARRKISVNREVYRVLNDESRDIALARLRDVACIILPNDTYVRADQVFWSEHPFGAYRSQLSPELKRYAQFFAVLGVRDAPDYRDARSVLLEVAADYAPANRPLDDDALGITLACWQILSRAIDSETVDSQDLRSLSAHKVVPNAERVLYQPAWIFFEDRAGLAAKFHGFLTRNVITRPFGAWQAMAQAGVRTLSSAVTSDLVECSDPLRNEPMHVRLDERRTQIIRVLDAQSLRSDDTSSILDRVAFFAVDGLMIQYTLSAFGKILVSQPEDASAHFLRKEMTLYYVTLSGAPPWPSVARELALALSPGEDAGALAAAIKDVLSAASDDEARSLLDELGVAPADETVRNGAVPGGYVEDIGGQAVPIPIDVPTVLEPDLGANVCDDIEVELGSTAPQPVAEAGDSLDDDVGNLAKPERPHEGHNPESNGVAAGTRTRTSSQPKQTTPSAAARHPAEQNQRGRANPAESARRPAEGRAQGRLRTYVSPGKTSDGTEPDEDRQEQLTALDRAGVDRVLEHERAAGRFPEELAHNNPGYDIISRDGNRRSLRFIEVKSVSGDWGSLGVALSRRQFDNSESHGERFWLYVIERALDDDFLIHRISDPGRRVDQFIYDDGWRALSEQDDPTVLTDA